MGGREVCAKVCMPVQGRACVQSNNCTKTKGLNTRLDVIVNQGSSVSENDRLGKVEKIWN